MSSVKHVIMLAFIWACMDIFLRGHSELMKMKISVERRVDGTVSAHICVGNMSSSTMLNRSLIFFMDTLLDDSQNVVGANGTVIDSNANQSLELSTIKEKVEEIEESLLNFFCPKEGEDKLNIETNSNWWSWREELLERRKQQADLPIVDGTVFTYSGENYKEFVNERTSYKESYKWNFLIAEDGSVFEVLGFDFYDKFYYSGLGSRSLIFGFIKRESDAAPSEKAMNTFHQLVKLAICSRKLIPLYKVIPYYLIYDPYRISNKSFERNQMSVWDRYESVLEFLSPYQKEEKFDLRIVPSSDWSEEVNEMIDAIDYSGPAENVVIMQSNGLRCFHKCSGLARDYIDSYLIRDANYFIPEDGYVYEFNGWSKTKRDWVKEKKAVVILLAGRFHSFGPNTIVFSALKALLQEGLTKGYLSANYKIVSLKEYIPASLHVPGEYLENRIKNLDISNIK